MNVLVLGGAGYIGSHTVRELIENGHSAVVVDSLEIGHRKAVDAGAVFYEGDLKDPVLLDKVFNENKIDACIDFAAYTVVAESMADPLKYYGNNLNGMHALLTGMLKHGADKIVFSSTASVYGIPERVPVVETDKTAPINPYGETKLAVEKMLGWAANAYGVQYISLRYFNVAGAHISGTIGEAHKPETHLVPLAVRAALSGDKFEIYGDDYDTADGTCVRDYVHVTDLAAAHILAVEKLMKNGGSGVYNLGNGKGFSNKEILDETERVTGRTINKTYARRRPGDPDALVASSEKIVRELNWRPKYARLSEIIGSAYVWHKNHPRGYDE